MITPELTQEIAHYIEQHGLTPATLTQLRQTYPHIHFTYCLDDEMGDLLSPVLTYSGFNIYLVDGRHHCFSLTEDYQAATGLVVAEIVEETL